MLFINEVKIALLFALLFGATACTLPAKISDAKELEQVTPQTTGVIMPVRFEVEDEMVKSGSCSMIVRPVGGAMKYSVPINHKKNLTFAELPEGVYGYQEIFCGLRYMDMAFLNIPHFVVKKDQISLVTQLNFKLVKEDSKIIYGFATRADDRKAALAALARLSPENADRFVSAYTTKKLAPLEDKDILKPVKNANPFLEMPKPRACIEKERLLNPLILGWLDLEVTYNNARFVNVKNTSKWNTYTSDFIDCVTELLKKQTPGTYKQITYNYSI